MPGTVSMHSGQSTHKGNLPFIQATMNYCRPISGHAVQDVLNPELTYIPLEAHEVRISDARPIRAETGLDSYGFTLLDHRSGVSHMRDTAALEKPYYDEQIDLISKICGADVVLPLSGVYVRFSPKMAIPGANETNLPAGYVHMDYTEVGLRSAAKLALEKAGLPPKDYRRIVLYQTWRAVSEPPQDFAFALTDGRSPKPGHVVVLDNIIGPREIPGNVTETQLAIASEQDDWYYFSDMREDELLLWKGYDTERGNRLNVLHSGFQTGLPHAQPRESIEARILAFWE